MKYKLENVCNKIYSGGTPSTKHPEYWGGELPWMSSGETSQRFIYTTEKFITEVGVKNSSTKYAKKQSTVMASAGQGHTRGQVSYLMKDMYVNQSILVFTPNTSLVEPLYLYYNLDGRYEELRQLSDGTSTRGSLSGKIVKGIEIDLPDKETQKKIVTILYAIDKKIEVNTQINRNLLEQLESLYDEWFGRFKPFNMGIGNNPEYELEEGWHIESIYSIANIIYGAPFASKLFNTEHNGKPIVRIRDLKEQSLCTFTTERHPKGYLLQPGDIVVGMDGEFKPHIWGNEEAWLNQRVCVFDNIRKNGKAYLYCTLKPLLYSVEATEVATTVIHIGKKDYDEFRVVLPPENILIRFEEISRQLFDEIVANQLENRRLVTLRELLIPKLMSGEIDVSNIEI